MKGKPFEAITEEGIKKGLKQLKEILLKDPEGKIIRETIEPHLKGNITPSTFPCLKGDLMYFLGKDVTNMILNIITNNDTKILKTYKKFDASDKVISFLRNLVPDYGPAAKRASLHYMA